ncbi:MAG TPA: Ig-like domain-containing protein [Gammaproteobacteria bacterium]|nr:Ig-like domain-containing protein [Gammaproteobacteria bacterium]
MKKIALQLMIPAALLLLSACGGGSGSAPSSTQADAAHTEAMVQNTYPSNGSAQAMANTKLSATFGGALDPSTVNSRTFVVKKAGSTPVSGSVSYSGVTAVFTPNSPLEVNTVYTATLTTGVESTDGTPLGTDYSWTFSTSPDGDGLPPSVTTTAFAVTQVNGVYGGVVVAFFTDAMDPDTINPENFLVQGPGGDLPGTVEYIGLSAVFLPSQPFAPDTHYTATLTTGVKDMTGQPLTKPVSWTFETPHVSILTGQSTTVATVAPSNMSTGVTLDSEVTVTFSQTMDPATITPNSFRLIDPSGSPVAGTVQYSGLSATFVPASPLQPDTTYQVVVSASAASLSGVPMDSAYHWSFTTGSESSNVPPVVQFTTPLAGDTSVALNDSILVAFDEPMDPLSLTTSTFTVDTADGMPVSGMVTYTGLTAVFTPSQQLDPGVVYTARVSTGAKDASGTPMTSDYVWSFTTGNAASVTAPQVLFTDPALGDANVPSAGPQIDIAFNEVVDPRTVNAGTIVVTGPDGAPVAGSFTYMAFAVIFTPSAPLQGLAQYTVTVNTGVKDLNDNAMPQDYSFYFSTAAAAGSNRPS